MVNQTILKRVTREVIEQTDVSEMVVQYYIRIYMLYSNSVKPVKSRHLKQTLKRCAKKNLPDKLTRQLIRKKVIAEYSSLPG